MTNKPKISNFIYLLNILVVTYFYLASSVTLQAQFVKNGSFEEHIDGMYPIGLTSADSYPNNQLMK